MVCRLHGPDFTQNCQVLKRTCMFVLLTLGPKPSWPRRMLPLVSLGKYADGIDRQTDQAVTLHFPLNAASVTME